MCIYKIDYQNKMSRSYHSSKSFRPSCRIIQHSRTFTPSRKCVPHRSPLADTKACVPSFSYRIAPVIVVSIPPPPLPTLSCTSLKSGTTFDSTGLHMVAHIVSLYGGGGNGSSFGGGGGAYAVVSIRTSIIRQFTIFIGGSGQGTTFTLYNPLTGEIIFTVTAGAGSAATTVPGVGGAVSIGAGGSVCRNVSGNGGVGSSGGASTNDAPFGGAGGGPGENGLPIGGGGGSGGIGAVGGAFVNCILDTCP